MSTQAVITSIRAHDFGVVSRAAQAGPDLADQLRTTKPPLDATSRQIAAAVVAKQNAAGAGNYLLAATGDDDVNVAAAAARGLPGVTDLPPAKAILTVLPLRRGEFVRAQLYYALGNTRSAESIERVRVLASTEADRRAAEAAQCALVKLGARPERAAFLDRVAGARPDRVVEITDQLRYIADVRLAKGIDPWFTNENNVARLGSDRGPEKMSRVCDHAVWTAHQLGVIFPPQPTHLDNYDGATISRALDAVRKIPD